MLVDFLASPAGIATKAALVAAFLDFAFGAFFALRDGSFALDSVAAFVRKHLLGRVLPIGVLAVMGYLTGDLAMITAGAAALTAYAAETMGSIYGTITESKAEAVATVPVD